MLQKISIYNIENNKTKVNACKPSYKYSGKVYITNYEDKKNFKSKEPSVISFKGLKGFRLYATPEDEEALAYKIQLTPEKIKKNIQNAQNYEAGILENYSLLDKEAKLVGKAFQGIINIRTSYKNEVLLKIQEIAKIDPVGSRIPIVGAIPQFLSMASGCFWDRLDCILNPINLVRTSSEIKNQYWDNGVFKMCNDYLKTSNAMLQSINENGLATNLSSKLYTVVEKGNTQIKTNLKVILEAIELQDEELLKIFYITKGKQKARQFVRTAVKGISFGIIEKLPDILSDLGSSTVFDTLVHMNVDKLAKMGLASIDNIDNAVITKTLQHI